jgi:ATP-dependent DNA helicase PIF1
MTQGEALAILDSGANVLLTGAAGTGKTYTLNDFIRRSRRRGKNVAVTATTGLAATHLGGNTIHAWSGIGVHDELPKYFADKLSKQRRDLITKADILIIDEISMMHDFRLDMVDAALRTARGTHQPFGGVQTVLCGDFFQLPPVNRADSRSGGFVTSSTVWQQGDFTVCYLEQQFRQSEDDIYAEILNGIRKGSLMRSQLAMLQARKEAFADPFLTQTRLLTTNADVDAINGERLDQLDEELHEYEMEATGGKQYVEQLKRSCLAPEVLRLKKGASVMCIKNSPDRKYVNGSLGTVIDFEEGTDYPKVKLNNGSTVLIRPESWELRDGDKRRASLTQLPLRLAWAITVHKSQGMTLDAARVDLSRAFVEGMGYVALSRVKNLKSLVLDGMNGMALRTSSVARAIDGELLQASHAALSTYADAIAAWQKDEAAGKHQEEAAVPVDELSPDDKPLFEALRTWRFGLAKEQNLPPYVIAHDATLKKVAQRKPKTPDELLKVPGFGPKRVESYGKDIVDIVKQH